MKKDEIEGKIDSLSSVIKDISVEHDLPLDVVLKIIAEHLGCECGSVRQYVKESKKPGRTPRWVRLCTELQKDGFFKKPDEKN